jgi:hypothetical protein
MNRIRTDRFFFSQIFTLPLNHIPVSILFVMWCFALVQVDALYQLEIMSLDSSSMPSVIFASLRDGMAATSIVGARVRTHLGSGIVSAARARGAGIDSVAAASADTPISPRVVDRAYEIEIDGVLQYLPSRFELMDSQSAKIAAAAAAAAAAASAANAATAATAGVAASADASKQTTPKKAGWLW